MSNLVNEKIYDSDESDFRDDDFEEEEEDEMENIPVKGLFSEKIYNSVVDMFKSEYQENNFNLVQLINKYKLSQIDYIKMINFIRAQVRFKSQILNQEFLN